MRTQDEIVSRIKSLDGGDDFLGFAREVLMQALDFEHAKQALQIKEEITKEKWEDGNWKTEDEIIAAAKSYLEFAWGKAQDHRGISAGRSVDKMTSFLWLLGRDEDLQKLEAAPYENYGCPKLKVAAEALGTPIPTDEDLVNMMAGGSCRPECDQGCGA